MIFIPYLVAREAGSPYSIVLNGVIPISDASFQRTFSICEFAAGGKLGRCLYLSFSDYESGAELLDLVMPDLPMDVYLWLTEGSKLLLEDAVTGEVVDIQFDKKSGKTSPLGRGGLQILEVLAENRSR